MLSGESSMQLWFASSDHPGFSKDDASWTFDKSIKSSSMSRCLNNFKSALSDLLAERCSLKCLAGLTSQRTSRSLTSTEAPLSSVLESCKYWNFLLVFGVNSTVDLLIPRSGSPRSGEIRLSGPQCSSWTATPSVTCGEFVEVRAVAKPTT